ncbi:DUF2799 domain-containing protein [Pikeienuella sp. HZG-20]|uniref:DUF2799 domain-containing protein n=1 Tax=Paludibacillus litoralis TaxID=3133267 RepID=UPI0030EF9E92
MLMTRIALLLLLPVLALAACAATTATLTPAQCAANWRAVGYEDGLDGADFSRLAAYREACARGGAALSKADEAAWTEGWTAAGGAQPAYEPRDDEYRRTGGYPRIYPQIGVGVGNHGVSVGGGVGIGLGSFGLGFYH